jgi:DNA-binding HxlR family transcriptional regulator
MVIYVLSFGEMRTGNLQRSMPGISKKMLTQTLRDLENDKLISRKVYQVVPPKVEYALTPLGTHFVEPLMALYEWSEQHAYVLDELERNRTARSDAMTETLD